LGREDAAGDKMVEFMREHDAALEQARFSRYGDARKELCEAAGIEDAYYRPGSIADLTEMALEQACAEAVSEKAVVEAKKRIEDETGDIVALIGKGALEAIKEQARAEAFEEAAQIAERETNTDDTLTIRVGEMVAKAIRGGKEAADD